MYDTVDEIAALFGEEAESHTLEFKSGRNFDNLSSQVRSEFVKDVSAFANGGGGTLIIGVAEKRDGQRSVAATFDPITNDRLTLEQLTSIIKSNTDPVFSDFAIKSIDLPTGGRVFVISIEKAGTAHQNKLDQRYYQRTGPISESMFDFAIRDVMNRRTRPHVKATFEIQTTFNQPERQKQAYRVVPSLSNEGTLTARHWALIVDLPANVAKVGTVTPGMPMRHRGNVTHNAIEFMRIELHSGPTTRNPGGTLLLPGQTLSLTLDIAFAELGIEISMDKRPGVQRDKPSLYSSFFLDDAPRTDEEIPFSRWFEEFTL